MKIQPLSHFREIRLWMLICCIFALKFNFPYLQQYSDELNYFKGNHLEKLAINEERYIILIFASIDRFFPREVLNYNWPSPVHDFFAIFLFERKSVRKTVVFCWLNGTDCVSGHNSS
jgi:hypothetical protein